MKLSLLLLMPLLGQAADKELASLTTDLDADGKADRIVISSAKPGDPDSDELLLSIHFGNGRSVSNPTLIRKAGLNEELGVKLQLMRNGSVLVRSVKDWGSSNWATDIYLSFRKGQLKISGFDYYWLYRDLGGGCEFNFLSGVARVKGKNAPFRKHDINFAPDSSLDRFIELCHKIGKD